MQDVSKQLIAARPVGGERALHNSFHKKEERTATYAGWACFIQRSAALIGEEGK